MLTNSNQKKININDNLKDLKNNIENFANHPLYLKEKIEALKHYYNENKTHIDILKEMDNLYLCTYTSSLPTEEGILFPRTAYEFMENKEIKDEVKNLKHKLKDSQYTKNQIKERACKHRNKLEDFSDILNIVFSRTDPTGQFQINSLDHFDERDEESDKDFIVIITPLKDALDQIVGGHLENIYSIGPFHLPKRFKILAHESQRDNFPDYLKDNVLLHNVGSRSALNDYLKIVGAKPLILRKFLKDIHFSFFGEIGNNYISSEELFNVINQYIFNNNLFEREVKKRFCPLDMSPIYDIIDLIDTDELPVNKPPFLDSFKDKNPKQLSLIIHKCVDLTQQSFYLNVEQVFYLQRYSKMLDKLISLFFNSITFKNLKENFEREKNYFKFYDHHINLKSDIKLDTLDTKTINHANKISEATGLTFIPRPRIESPIIDAVTGPMNIDVFARYMEQLNEGLEDRPFIGNVDYDNFGIIGNKNYYYILYQELNNPDPRKQEETEDHIKEIVRLQSGKKKK